MARLISSRLVSFATVLVAVCLPLSGIAQHGGFASHGAPSHIGGGFHASAPSGGFGRTSPPSFHMSPSRPGSFGSGSFRPGSLGPGQFRPGYPRSGSPGFSSSRTPAPRNFARSGTEFRNRIPRASGYTPRFNGENRPDHYRNPYRRHGDRDWDDRGRVWANSWTLWGVPFYPGYPYLGYPYDFGYDGDDYETAPYQDAYTEPPYYDQQPYRDEPAPGPASGYGPEETPAPATESAPPPAEDPITLIFKDGRQPEQIHNYMVTATTLYVLDQHRREIPLSQVDVAATENANRGAGVDFHLPGGTP